MADMSKIINELKELHGSSETMKLISDTIVLLEEQAARIRELEEKLRLLEYGDQDILQRGVMPMKTIDAMKSISNIKLPQLLRP